MATPRVATNRQTYFTSYATSVQWTDSSLMVVLQQMAMPRVVIRPQANRSPVAKSARLCRQNTSRLRGNASHTPKRREVRMIFGGPCKVGDSRCAQDRYSQKVKKPPQVVVHTTSSKPTRDYAPQPDYIVFTQADASWVYHPHENALVITVEVANILIHRLLVDSGSIVNILWCDPKSLIKSRVMGSHGRSRRVAACWQRPKNSQPCRFGRLPPVDRIH